MSHWVHIGFNPWLEACAAYLAVAGQCVRLPPQHTLAHPRLVRVAGCSRQLVHPWSSGPQALHRTDSLAQDGGWRAQTGHLGWKAHQVFFCLWGAVESQEDIASLPTLLRHSRAKALVALALEPTRGLLLASCHCFYQLLKKDWRKFYTGHRLEKG